MHALRGHCHCGNLELTMETGLAAEALPIRECQCSFCRRHGARTTTDPNGTVRIRVRDVAVLSRYRFGLRSADFLVCKHCGNYLGAFMTHSDGRSYATVNVNLLEAAARFTQTPATVSYDGETVAQRCARRVAKWTPVVAFD